MAKVLEAHEFRQASFGRGAKHPWDEWLDGQIRMLDSEDFGDAKLGTIVMGARKAAKRKGLKVRAEMNSDKNTVILQAVPDPDAGKPEPEANGEAKPAAEKPAAKKGKKTSAAAK